MALSADEAMRAVNERNRLLNSSAYKESEVHRLSNLYLERMYREIEKAASSGCTSCKPDLGLNFELDRLTPLLHRQSGIAAFFLGSKYGFDKRIEIERHFFSNEQNLTEPWRKAFEELRKNNYILELLDHILEIRW